MFNNRKDSTERNSALGPGSVRTGGRIASGLSKMEEDHHKSCPTQGRRWTMNVAEERRSKLFLILIYIIILQQGL